MAQLDFRPALAAPLTQAFLEHMQVNQTSQECPGPGRAHRGFLCVYDVFASASASFLAFTNPSTSGDPGSSVDGVAAIFSAGSNHAIVKGVWALTAR